MFRYPHFNQDEQTPPVSISTTFLDPASRVVCKTQSDRISQKTATCADSIVEVIVRTQTGFYDTAEKIHLVLCKDLFLLLTKRRLNFINLLSFLNCNIFQWQKKIMMLIANFGDSRLSKVPLNLVYMDKNKFFNRYNGLQLSLSSLSFASAKENL